MNGEMIQRGLFLSTGDPSFADLFGGREYAGGIGIPSDTQGTLGTSVVISGLAGSGKTILACQLCAMSLCQNNHLATKDKIKGNWWPKNGQAVIYTLDQRAQEIRDLILRFGWLEPTEIAVIENDQKLAKIVEPLDDSETVSPSDYTTKRLFIRALDENTSLNDLIPAIQSDTYSRSSTTSVKIVVIDSINMLMQHGSNDYLKQFRDLFKAIRRGLLDRATVILTLEENPSVPMMEEYVPHCVIHLDRSVQYERGIDGLMRRTIEIRKARGQAHALGMHDCTIVGEESRAGLFPNEFFDSVLGMRVYPSLASRARDLRQVQPPEGSVGKAVKFGHSEIDSRFEGEEATKLRAGSATLLWGPPGSGKTELGIYFLRAQWQEEIDSSVLLITSKIDPGAFVRSLDTAANEGLHLLKQIGGHQGLRERTYAVDARDPFRTHGSICSEIIDCWEFAASRKRPIRRAMVFGLGLIEETPAVRDSQWRFLSVLVSLLTQRGITTLLVDWPAEGQLHGNSDGARPRASKLCSNELRSSVTQEGEPTVQILRGNYSSLRRTESVPVGSSRLR